VIVINLREIPVTEVDEALRRKIERLARQHGCNYTILEGLISKNISIVMHAASKPSAELIEQYEREEFAAMPTSRDYQQ
jgi:hypothetical protein